LFRDERLGVRRAYALKALRMLQAYQFSDVYGSWAPVKSQTRAWPFRDPKTRTMSWPLCFGVWIVLPVIGGSILIMTNPNANMMPM
jgi:hypothetical protein